MGQSLELQGMPGPVVWNTTREHNYTIRPMLGYTHLNSVRSLGCEFSVAKLSAAFPDFPGRMVCSAKPQFHQHYIFDHSSALLSLHTNV